MSVADGNVFRQDDSHAVEAGNTIEVEGPTAHQVRDHGYKLPHVPQIHKGR